MNRFWRVVDDTREGLGIIWGWIRPFVRQYWAAGAKGLTIAFGIMAANSFKVESEDIFAILITVTTVYMIELVDELFTRDHSKKEGYY